MRAVTAKPKSKADTTTYEEYALSRWSSWLGNTVDAVDVDCLPFFPSSLTTGNSSVTWELASAAGTGGASILVWLSGTPQGLARSVEAPLNTDR